MTSYDLRVYDVVQGQFETLQRVLREVPLPIMADHGMRPTGFWADPAGSKLYQITDPDRK